jgi:TetR/AcrR family transcriptional regulator, fatty acid biosynthesis regulator
MTTAGPARSLSREEAKLITRRRLLDAAAQLLGESGYGGLAASAVSRAAGVAQPTFYVHFRDKDDLVRALADERIGGLRSRLREARERLRLGEGVDAVRETFRIPLQTFLENPAIFRVYARELHEPESPVGEKARTLREELLRDLAEDLARLGLPSSTPAEREALEMTAEAMIGQVEALGLALVDGRYKSLDAVVEVLTRFAVGILGLS